MKAHEIFDDTATELHVARFPMHFGRRTPEFEKLVWKPFIKELDTAMRQLKGKWNGSGYTFKTVAQVESAQRVMNEFESEWSTLISKYPEGQVHLDASIADDYFKRNKKNKM